MKRCSWASEEPEATYHDEEWGVAVHDDRVLFEFLILEGAQAGLSWRTILNKREGYREAFCDFDIKKVAEFTQDDVKRLMQDKSIVRNRLKIESAIKNAKVVLELQEEFGSFSEYIWSFFPEGPQKITRESVVEFPAQTQESKQLSKDLKKRGCNFVGPTIMYSFMQAVGVVDEHETNCWRA